MNCHVTPAYCTRGKDHGGKIYLLVWNSPLGPFWMKFFGTKYVANFHELPSVLGWLKSLFGLFLNVLQEKPEWTFLANPVGFPRGSEVKNLLVKQELPWEPLIWFLGKEDPLEQELATRSSILAWEVPHGQPMRVGHDLAAKQQQILDKRVFLKTIFWAFLYKLDITYYVI